ncbi:hypothetical protein HJC23_009146 [Cyclotella cryptica]|uniref:Sigma 54 modulation/S30EA ribosomal protein C-terminal domain-containing protein n=1 Tax=Cyclotella cryptica TaxID=29204 RepID=A0ABD3P1H3_9STRA|eukprot:CCRYP_018456-RB/>CCRYP_018456-RB protein AED:0.07 eAED:0.07 QI:220/1/1/1/1/1/4/448/236
MYSSAFMFISVLASCVAFSPAPSFSSRAIAPSKPLQMTVKAPIVITGDNIDLTPALSDYVNQKIERTLGKLPTAVSHCDVYLSVNKNPKVENRHIAEVVTTLKGTTFRVAENSPDMYQSIDLVASRLARKLRKYKERRLDGYHGGPNMGENLADVLNSIEVDESVSDDEVFIDPEQTVVTKVKSFDLSTPISIKEAIFALDYIDHDFYVFRDEETNEVSVVYKRNAGGVGLIQPEQ